LKSVNQNRKSRNVYLLNDEDLPFELRETAGLRDDDEGILFPKMLPFKGGFLNPPSVSSTNMAAKTTKTTTNIRRFKYFAIFYLEPISCWNNLIRKRLS
jgi:hypothetical protein